MLEAIVLAADLLAATAFLFAASPPDRARLTRLVRRAVAPVRGGRRHVH